MISGRSSRRLQSSLLMANMAAAGSAVDCESYVGTIHLLLTDVVMPGMNGLEVASMVSGMRPAVKVIYMSGYTDDAVVRHGVMAQDMAFLQKPFTPDRLRHKIVEVLGE